jgi:hypothetical protein
MLIGIFYSYIPFLIGANIITYEIRLSDDLDTIIAYVFFFQKKTLEIY